MVQPSSPGADPQLRRDIGRWSWVALAINSILGSGIFGLPSVVAGLTGRWSPLVVLLAGAAMAVVIGCYAEAASQFTETGGQYLFVRHAFGRLAGLQVGWMNLLSRLTACAAAVNLLVISLGQFWPQATERGPRFAVMTLLVATLARANYRGVASGTRMSNLATLAKLAPLAVICVAGLGYLAVHPVPAHEIGSHGRGGWLDATLLLFFAYGGYEAALNPMGEARDPRRDAGFALIVALAVVTVVYTTLQLIVVSVVPDAAHSARPLADAARVVLGAPGATLVSAGALISVYGYLSANLLTVPRGTYALAARGDFPAAFAAIHPRYRTPHLSILAVAVAVWVFALSGSFAWNVTLSAVARLFYYAAVCAAVPVLRRRQPQAALYRLPGGMTLPALGILICVALLTRVDFSRSLILITVIFVATVNWLLVRNRGATPRAA